MAQREMVLNITLLGIPAAALLAALSYHFGGWGPDWPDALAWSALPALFVLVYDAARALWQKHMGVDVLAILSILVALQMGEHATAAVIAAMAASGRLLENYAAGRAIREMEALLQNVPRLAHRLNGEQIQTVPVNDIRPGDTLLVKQGEMVPVDGPLASAAASLDESSLTGEALPILQTSGDLLRSGALNAGDSFRMIAAKRAADSTFSAIVMLVQQAAAAKSPATRMADRYAAWFIPLTVLLAGAAWLISGDPIRALAVLVVATPCPLLLAVPVAQVSGISRCAGRGVLVKGGAALEGLAQADMLFFDKTGTLTGGQAKLIGIRGHGQHEAGELLRLVAALDQMSCHVLATAILRAAHERGVTELPLPEGVEETAGAGICGRVDGRRVAAGTPAFILARAASEPWLDAEIKRLAVEGSTAVFVAIDGKLEGLLELSDPLRLETPRALRLLRRAGVRRIAMLTGDKREVAESIGSGIGVDEVHAELSPAGKLARIAEAAQSHCTMMIGDGVNDAPALASAQLGVAMGARGAAAAAESAGVVLLIDKLDRLAEAKMIAVATMRIARQSVALGMALSLLAMLVAAAGYLPPLDGALLQEAIDVAAILNALNALRIRPLLSNRTRLAADKVQALREEHQKLEPLLAQLSDLARALPTMMPDRQVQALQALNGVLRNELIPHEQADEQALYPAVSSLLGGDDPLAALSRSHQEIFRGIHRLSRLFDPLQSPIPEPVIQDIQRTLYGLEAVLRLHFAQENELFSSLSP